MNRAILPLLILTLLAFLMIPEHIAFAEEEVQPHASMLRYPDVSQDKIAFVFADDLWVVAREGGRAEPLASPPGMEQHPKFSADGQTIAFMGNYEGNRDLYTIPLSGGVPHRLTHHPGREILCDWTPDGGLLFYTSGLSGLGRMPKLFKVGREGGLPDALPLPYGAVGAVSPDGEWLAYTPHTRDTRTWKRYRGGMATDIWLFNLKTLESRKITEWEGTDTLPMWHRQKVYYLSDEGGGKLNIWAYDMNGRGREQVTRFTTYDVKWPSMGPGDEGQGEIVFQNGSYLYILDLETERHREVPVTVPGARPKIGTQRIDASEFIRSWSISPTGKRAVVQARGDVWTLPAEHGSPRNLTRTSGTAERSPSWSPDGQWIAYFSDATGEYELYITQSDGKGETKQLTSGSETFYDNISWSPDSKRVAFTDKALQIYLHTIDVGETKIIDKDPWGRGRMRINWSHDSRWITYARPEEDNPTPAVWLYNVDEGTLRKATSGMFGDSSPVFDRKGDYLFFSSMRHFSPTYSNVDTTFIYDEGEVLIAIPLLEEVESPWLPESDEEKWEDKEAEKDEEKEDGEEEKGEEEETEESDEESRGKKGKEAPPADDVTGTWEGTADTPEGTVEFSATLKLEGGNRVSGSISSLMFSGEVSGSYDPAGKTLNLVFYIPDGPAVEFELKIENGTMTGTWSAEGDTGSVQASRISGEEDSDDKGEKKGKKEKAREKVEIDWEGFERRAMMLPVSKGNFGRLAVNDKNQLIYARTGSKGGIKLFDMKDKKKEEKTVAAGSTRFTISADGKKLLVVKGGSATIQNASAGSSAKKVVTDGMTAYITPREEWKQVFTEVWRLQRDFLYVDNMHGVDWPAVRERYGSMLQDCNTREDVSYLIREMISEINIGHAYYRGVPTEEEPSVNVGLLGVDFELHQGAYRIKRIYEGAPWDVDARGPLSEAGIDVKEGDYLLAVNGMPVNAEKDPWAAFLGSAGKTITIIVSENPKMDEKARDVVVKPARSESNLRYRAWIERNRAYVDEKTDGRVGYIYVPDTGVNGQNNLVRQYFGQIHKEALIIDERWNGGGQVPTRFIEMMNRPITNYWARRDGKDTKWPPDAHHGPKCMLINGLAGSGGDMFPFLFRQAKLGKLIGTRTWGGLVGISGNPGLIDGSGVTVPTFGFYEKDGTWGIEGHGVDPDPGFEVIDDPALMVDGGDPQLDFAIKHMLEEIERAPYVPVKRPDPPDRSGMGIKEEDK